MMARIIAGVAFDVCEQPEELFHMEMLSEFEDVPNHVGNRWRIIDGEWVEPDADESPVTNLGTEAASLSLIDPVLFKLRFTAQSRIAIRAARATNPVVDDLWDLLDDPRYQMVDLASGVIIRSVRYLQSVGLITEAEGDAVLSLEVNNG